MVHTTAHPPELLRRLLSGNATAQEYTTQFGRSAQLMRDFAMRSCFDAQRRSLLTAISERMEAQPRAIALAPALNRFWILLTSAMWASPEWLLPLGYDEIRFSPEAVIDSDVSASSAGAFAEGAREFAAEKGLDPDFVDVAFKSLLLIPQLRTPNGVWHDLEHTVDSILPPGDEQERTLDEWVERVQAGWLSKLATTHPPEKATVYMPALHTPLSNYPEIRMQSAARGILEAIADERVALADLPWRRLEELIAELLHDSGLQVEITPRSHDGGRDVIARGELFPGEPTVLAVEVKQMEVVPVATLRAALWANREFPALLFVTSGRFSAGVYREKADRGNVLRLYLKDGRALDQWIHTYARRRGLTPN